MGSEENSIFDEINEELKNEQLFAFMKKYQKTILSVVAVAVVGIIAYSSWYSRKNKQMEETSLTLLNVLQNPTERDDIVITELLAQAPAELKPVLSIMKSGKKLMRGAAVEESMNSLLELSQKHGVDIIWKDLALLIYVSYSIRPAAELVDLLKPLTSEDRPLRFSALEFIGVIYEKIGDHEEALKSFDSILKSEDAPGHLKQRVSMLANHIKNKLGK